MKNKEKYAKEIVEVAMSETYFCPKMRGADELAHGRCILPRLWVYRDTAFVGFAANRFTIL